MAVYKKVVPIVDGGIVKLEADAYVTVNNRSASTVTIAVSFFIDDSTRVKSTSEASGVLPNTSHFDNTATTETWFTADTVTAGTSKTTVNKLPAGAKVRVTGGVSIVTVFAD